jgi:hypothetical protein
MSPAKILNKILIHVWSACSAVSTKPPLISRDYGTSRWLLYKPIPFASARKHITAVGPSVCNPRRQDKHSTSQSSKFSHAPLGGAAQQTDDGDAARDAAESVDEAFHIRLID